MSIKLYLSCLEVQNLTQSEKHILKTLCFRANQHNEVYSSIERLSLDCSCSIKTVERTLKLLRDKCFLNYTGKIAPNSKSIPVYSIKLNHGQNGGALNLPTDKLFLTDGQNGDLRTDKMGIGKDNIYKDNKKDICSSFIPSQLERNEVYYFINSPYELPEKLLPAYFWLKENGHIK